MTDILDGFSDRGYPFGVVPFDFNEDTGLSATYEQVRNPETGLWDVGSSDELL